MTFGLLLILLLVVLGIWYLLDRREKARLEKGLPTAFILAPYICVLCHSHSSIFGWLWWHFPLQLDC